MNDSPSKSAEPNRPPAASQPAVDVRAVTVRRGDTVLLENVDWRVDAGASVGLLGPNGCGKSTLARVVLGQLWPTTGDVTVLGRPFGQTDLNDLRRDVRLVQATGPLPVDPDLTALDVVCTGRHGTVNLYQPVDDSTRRRAGDLLRHIGLGHRASGRFDTLSTGERMRCLIARALLEMPKLLILDEITAGLDLLAREQVVATVARLTDSPNPPATVMITHHVEELLPATSSVLILKAGSVAASGTPQDVLTAPVLSDVYGVPVDVSVHAGRYWVRARSWERLLS